MKVFRGLFELKQHEINAEPKILRFAMRRKILLTIFSTSDLALQKKENEHIKPSKLYEGHAKSKKSKSSKTRGCLTRKFWTSHEEVG